MGKNRRRKDFNCVEGIENGIIPNYVKRIIIIKRGGGEQLISFGIVIIFDGCLNKQFDK